MDNFHPDIIENILSRLSIQPALHAKRVCTTWRAVLRNKPERSGFLFAFSHDETNNEFRKELFYGDEHDHYDHGKINYYHSDETVSKIEHGRFISKYHWRDVMVGSCNGLVCLGKDDDKYAMGTVPFLVCNPLTGESVFLPEYDYSALPRDISSKIFYFGSVSSGFGYCNATNSYKVVTIYYHYKERKGHVQVYTIGGRRWRYIGFISRFNQKTFGFSSGIYANGALHWWSTWLHKQCEIVAFDLESEKFGYITLPCSYHPPLKLLGGNNNLYLVTGNGTPRTDIWVYSKYKITKEYNQERKNKSSSPWIKEFSIESGDPLYKHITPFAVTRNNQVLLWHHWTIGLMLYCYDPNSSALNNLWDLNKVRGMKCIYTQAIPHIQSVVSLKDLGETNIGSLKHWEKLKLQVKSNSFGVKVDRSYITKAK